MKEVLGAAGVLKASAKFQKYLVDELGLAPKADLIGMSWGGFYSTRYAANYPENVDKIYLDAPLLCFWDFYPDPDVKTWIDEEIVREKQNQFLTFRW